MPRQHHPANNYFVEDEWYHHQAQPYSTRSSIRPRRSNADASATLPSARHASKRGIAPTFTASIPTRVSSGPLSLTPAARGGPSTPSTVQNDTQESTSGEEEVTVVQKALDDARTRLKMDSLEHAVDRISAENVSEESAGATQAERDADDLSAAAKGASQWFGPKFAELVERKKPTYWSKVDSRIPIDDVIFAHDVLTGSIRAVRNRWAYLSPQSQFERPFSYADFCARMEQSLLATGYKYAGVLETLVRNTATTLDKPLIVNTATLADEDLKSLADSSDFLRYKLESLKLTAEKIYKKWHLWKMNPTNPAVRHWPEDRAIDSWQDLSEQIEDAFDDAYWMSRFGHRLDEITAAAKQDQLPDPLTMEYMSNRVLEQAEATVVKKAVAEADRELQDDYDAKVESLLDLREAASEARSRKQRKATADSKVRRDLIQAQTIQNRRMDDESRLFVHTQRLDLQK